MLDEEAFGYAKDIVPKGYVEKAEEALSSRRVQAKVLLNHRRIPQKGWDEGSIEALLGEFSMMDSNNFTESVGVGEREGRVASSLVSRRHFRLTHGIGRSGDVTAVQPKAAGSSLINKLTQSMTLHALRISGVNIPSLSCVVLPVATGLALALTLMSLRNQKKGRYIIFPRIDQKSCIKAMLSAGFEVIVVPNVLEGDELRTDLKGIEETIAKHGAENIFCVMSTTSCFAPRGCDRIVEIAVMCEKLGVGHVINNAYGLQTGKCTALLTEACQKGKVDAFVQSTDKNFMVPVGGSVVASPSEPLIKRLAQSYPGRASMTPLLDVFITFLTLGEEGYRALLSQRKEVYRYFRTRLTEFCEKRDDVKLLATPNNPISMAIALLDFANEEEKKEEEKNEEEGEKREKEIGEGEEDSQKQKMDEKSKQITMIGSMLFSRRCSGARTISGLQRQTIGDLSFVGWGSHDNSFPYPYITVAAAIGMKKEEVDLFLKRLEKSLNDFKKKKRKGEKKK